ncbi:MAG TPA: AMP-binding protein, partial [Thermoanaerobaculia bacterium]|nr:AMP-binding protein [Thermoanaerobaculia bacterium]
MSRLGVLVVGDAGVTLRCAEILVARGHAVRGVVTGDGRVAGWAAGRGIACYFAPPEAPLGRADVLALTGGAPFDLLLSIHNLRILPGEVLSLPSRMAVNYHDALLPRYAGLHATTWALLAGERSHGITWHRMTEAVDAGEILLQRRFVVEPEDTAWTLNVRCAEAAAASFPELLERLAAGAAPAQPQPQDMAARTWFPGWRKPAPGCVVPWDAPAEMVSAFVRALDFGLADNPLGLPRLLAPGGPVVLHSVEVLARRSGLPPGTVVASGAAGVEIATATRNVLIPPVAASFRLVPGVRLPVEAPAAAELAARERVLWRHEGYWAAVLGDLAPLAPPGFIGEAGGETAEVVGEVSAEQEEELLAAVLQFLAFEVGQPIDVALGEPELRKDGAFFAARLPIRIDGLEPLTLPGFASRLRQKRAELREHGTYAADLPARLRRLRGQPAEPAVVVDLLADGESPPPLGAATVLAVAIRGRTITWRSPLAGVDERLAELAGRFECWLVSSQGGGMTAEPLIHLFQSQAARNPDSLALVAGGVRWTYRELAARVARLASALRRRGVGPERLVALRLERLPDLVTGMLGVLAAGGAFLVLDPLETPARTAHILAAARPALAVGDAGLHRLAPDLAVHPIAIADAPEGPALSGAVAAGWNLAYVAFTSGSSGVPKGVAVEQRAITHYIRAAGRRFGLGAGDRILQLGSPAFDLAFEQIFGALCHGAALVGLDTPHLPATRELLEECARLGITVLDLPTAVWAQMVRDIKMLTLPLPPDLRLVIIGGELATVRTFRDWRAGPGGSIRLINTY